MKYHRNPILVLTAIASFAGQNLALSAEFPSGYLKWEQGCHEASLKVRSSDPANPKLDRFFANCPGEKSAARFKMGYRQLHVVTRNLFHHKRKDVRKASINMLQKYDCENLLACEELLSLLNIGLKENAQRRFTPFLRQIGTVRDRAQKKVSELKMNTPKYRAGICGEQARREYWVGSLYSLYCPPRSSPTSHCGSLANKPDKCTGTHWLKNDLEQFSGQVVLSSSFLRDFSSRGVNECRDRWHVYLSCGGMKDVTYSLGCKKDGKTVQCRSLAHK